MRDFEELYHIMFNAVTDAERKIEGAAALLRAAQQKCEELYVESEEEQLSGKNTAHAD